MGRLPIGGSAMTAAERQRKRREVIAMRHMEKKEAIERELERCARATPMRRPTYTELGRAVGMPPMGPWEPVLDAIAKDAEDAGRPDLTFLVRNARTGYPSRVCRTTRRNLLRWHKERARAEMQRIIEAYNPTTPNPLA
jgi:hypothetical protein